jgi:hypothetical protein
LFVRDKKREKKKKKKKKKKETGTRLEYICVSD